jgi:hypothetical protein
MRLDRKFSSLWRFIRIKAARANRVLSDADDDDDMVFQVHSEEKKLVERKAPSALSSGNTDERAK